MATRRPAIRLKSVDLPTLGRPTRATRGRLTRAVLPRMHRKLRSAGQIRVLAVLACAEAAKRGSEAVPLQPCGALAPPLVDADMQLEEDLARQEPLQPLARAAPDLL